MNPTPEFSLGGAAGQEARAQQDAARARVELAQNIARFRRAAVVGLIVWPSFTAADVLALHTFGKGVAASAVLGPRLAAFAFIAVVVGWVLLSKNLTLAKLVVVDQGLYTLANVTIGLMSVPLGGLGSPYIAGACLVLSARMFAIPYGWRRAILAVIAPTLGCPLTVLAGVALDADLQPQLHDPQQLARFALSCAYVVGTAIFMVAGGHLIATLRQQLSAERDIGKYRLRRRLGLGGMGEVWAAWHSGLKRDVALKILKPGVHDEAAIARFELEVRTTSELTHPNTVRVFDYGSTDDGLFYYAMELLEGEDLGALVKREGPLPPARAVHLVLQAARALAEAHARGIVHRDVKPENVFVTSAGGEGDFVKLLDFGIARFDSSEAQQKLTGAGVLVGTPRYMAPEVMRGELALPRADTYALGAVLYFALKGQAPFQKTEQVALVAAIVSPQEAPRVDREGVSEALKDVVARALKKDPAQRFTDAELLVRALAEVPEAQGWHPHKVAMKHLAALPAPPAQSGLQAIRREATPAPTAEETATQELPKP